MPRFVSNIRKHITTTEFWRALSFVLKRLESIAKYLIKLPLPFIFIFYILHLIRAGLRIFSYFRKTKNKNLGETCKLLFALFKVSIAVIALILLGFNFISLPSALLGSFFAYSILKLIHSLTVLLFSTVFYLKLDKNCIEEQWMKAQYRDNITKHACLLGAGLVFVLLTCIFNAGSSILIATNPLLWLSDVLICAAVLMAVFYFRYQIFENKRTTGYFSLKKDQIAKVKKFLWMFGFGIVALLLAAATPWVGAAAITVALVLLCAQDILLTLYYYFYGVYIPDPEPANLKEPLNACINQTSRNYYYTFLPILYLRNQVSESFQKVEDVNKANKVFLLRVAFLKLLQLENKLEKILKLGAWGQFFSSKKKINLKKNYLLYELAWALNTENKEVLIDFFIQAIIDVSENTRVSVLENNLCELLDLLDIESVDYFTVYCHPYLKKNFLCQLFFITKQTGFLKQKEVAKPKSFHQSFWKKVGTCEALSLAFRASREIEQHLNLSRKPCVLS